MPALKMLARGLTSPLPAMSGAEPCTGSNIEGKRRSGSRLALGARPMLPTRIAEISLRISPNRLDPTTTSKLSGRRHVGVLIECGPDRQQQAVQRDVIGNVPMADSPEKDGVKGTQQIQPFRRHHPAVREKVLCPPVEVLELAGEVMFLSGAPENA